MSKKKKKKKKESPIEKLRKQLKKRLPKAEISLDPPASKDGVWFLDVEHAGHHVFIQWKGKSGFGISASPEHAYGMGPDEVYVNDEAAFFRVLSLLLSGTYTAPPEAVQLSELRRERGISQEELAEALRVRQGSVSKLERRKDMRVSSIRNVIRSMGGELKIIACFPDGMEKTLEFGEAEESTRERATKLKTS